MNHFYFHSLHLRINESEFSGNSKLDQWEMLILGEYLNIDVNNDNCAPKFTFYSIFRSFLYVLLSSLHLFIFNHAIFKCNRLQCRVRLRMRNLNMVTNRHNNEHSRPYRRLSRQVNAMDECHHKTIKSWWLRRESRSINKCSGWDRSVRLLERHCYTPNATVTANRVRTSWQENGRMQRWFIALSSNCVDDVHIDKADSHHLCSVSGTHFCMVLYVI
jgi:hypothetical protein